MARPLRRLVADGWYHVFGRGTERREIFSGPRDREHFLELLAELPERYRVRVHGYALMDNHYHAIMQTPEANQAGEAVAAWVYRQSGICAKTAGGDGRQRPARGFEQESLANMARPGIRDEDARQAGRGRGF